MLACMRQHMPEAEVQKHGCHAVANMCADPALRDVVLALGGVPCVRLGAWSLWTKCSPPDLVAGLSIPPPPPIV